MDRNSIIGIILIAGILILWTTLNKPSKEQVEEAKRKRDSLELVQRQEIAQQKIEEAAQIQETDNNVTEEVVAKDSILHSLYGSFADAGAGEQKFITLENELIKLKISNKGGRPYSVELKDYKTYTQKPLILFDGDSTVFGLNFFSQNRSIITNDLYYVPVEKTSSSVKMRLYAGEDRYIEYVYSLNPESYMVDFDIHFVGINEVVSSNLNVIDLKFSMYSPQQEKGAKNENMYTTMGYKYYQDEVNTLSSRGKDEAEEEINTKLKWVSYQQQFFSTILVADNYFANAEVAYTSLEDYSIKYLKYFESSIGIPIENSPNFSVPMSFYFGPNHFNTLKEYDLEFEKIIPLGWGIFGWINRFVVIPTFNILDNFIRSYGLIILILTVLIKLVLFPFTYKSYLSTAKMRVLKPEIEEINKKFPKKEDAMKKQQATMALYKKVGVNPMGGCIPMLIQMPILFAMFRFFPSSFELRQQAFLWADDLSSYDSILSWDAHIPVISNFYGDHISLFTILMALALLFSSKLNSNQMSDANQQMPGMKFMMTYMMPVMLLVFFNNYSAGLSYYYFLSNVITLGQTLFIRRFVDDEEILRKLHENKKKPVKKSKWQQRLEEAAKQKGYNPQKKK